MRKGCSGERQGKNAVRVALDANWKLTPAASPDLAYSSLRFNDASDNDTNKCTPVMTTRGT